jgi:TonB family protein
LEKTTKFNPDGTENQVPDSTDTSDPKVPAFPCNPLYQSKDTDCGGTSLMMYLRDHIIYPESARKLGIEGTASLNFVVEKDGSVAQVQIINGISDAIKKECLRIVSEMPKWTPGSANGVPVKVKYTLPIRFRLE